MKVHKAKQDRTEARQDSRRKQKNKTGQENDE